MAMVDSKEEIPGRGNKGDVERQRESEDSTAWSISLVEVFLRLGFLKVINL